MNRSDQAGEQTSETGRAVSKQTYGGFDIDILSDNGDEYCECPDLNIRPCSRDFYSEEEFEDAEAEQLPGSRSSHLLGGTGQASTTSPKVTGGSAEDGEGRSRQEDTEGQSAMTGRKDCEMTEQVPAPVRTDGEAPPATRHRSHSRIPVPAGKSLPSPRTAVEKGSKTELSHQMEEQGKDHFSSLRPTQETTFAMAANSSDEFEGRDLSSAAEMPCDASQGVNCNKSTKRFLTLSEPRRHEESKSDLELSRVKRSRDVGDLKYFTDPGELSAFYGAGQSEFVVMTLAEERNHQKSEAQKRADLGKPLSSQSGRTAPKAGRRQMSRGGAVTKERSRGDLTSSSRLNAIIRDRSRLALMKESEPLSRDCSRQKVQSGRMSADKAQERPFQRNRLQAIRDEKAQIRQRMSATKPVSPVKSRKLLSTPTIKQALTNTIGATSLKKEMLQRRSAIERMSKEIEAARTTVPQAPTSKMLKTDAAAKDVQVMKEEYDDKQNEITDSANKVEKIKPGSKDAVPCYPEREDGHQDNTEAVNKEGRAAQIKQRARILDKVPHYSRTPRTPGELTIRGDAKAELCSLSARYQARLKKYQDQKADIIRTQRELCKTVTTLNQLRSSIVGLAGEDPGELEAPQLLTERQPPSQVHTAICTEGQHLPETSTTVIGINTEPQEERAHLRILNLETEKTELISETEKIKKENEYLKKLEKEHKERESELRRELSNTLLSLKEYEKKVKELELKLADRGNSISQLRGNIAKLQDLPEKLKQKEDQIASLRRRLLEEGKEHNVQMKSFSEAKEALHQDMQKERENFQLQLKAVQEENNSLKAQLDQTSEKIVFLEQKQSELESQLEREMKNNHDLHEMLMSRENDLVNLERKLEETENSSCNIIGLSEQLMQKDSIISELEKHRANIQSQNRDMYSLLSSVFTIFGKEVNEKEIETSLTTGRISTLSDKLTDLVSKKIGENTKDNRNSEEYEKRILQLENRVAVLQAELEESKNYSETLAGVISEGNPWETFEHTENGDKKKYPSEVDGSEGDHPSKLIEEKCNGAPCILRSPTIGLIKHNNGQLTEGSIQELFVLLEGKRQALLRMERKMRELEEIHANCAQKRVRNEIRIDQLEMMLAMYKE